MDGVTGRTTRADQLSGFDPRTRWQSPRTAQALPLISRFPAGMHITHPVWGEGMVLNSRLQDDDEIVDIFFEAVGLKRVAASLANLILKK